MEKVSPEIKPTDRLPTDIATYLTGSETTLLTEEDRELIKNIPFNLEDLTEFIQLLEGGLFLDKSVFQGLLRKAHPDVANMVNRGFENDTYNYPRVTDMIRVLKERTPDGEPSTIDYKRPFESRVVALCGSYAYMSAAIAREHGVPARVRVGFSKFLPLSEEMKSNGIRFVGHWMLECYDTKEKRWKLIDVNGIRSVAKYNSTHGTEINWQDLRNENFIFGAEAYLDVFNNPENKNRYFVGNPTQITGLDASVLQLGFDLGNISGTEPTYGNRLPLDSDQYENIAKLCLNPYKNRDLILSQTKGDSEKFQMQRYYP